MSCGEAKGPAAAAKGFANEELLDAGDVTPLMPLWRRQQPLLFNVGLERNVQGASEERRWWNTIADEFTLDAVCIANSAGDERMCSKEPDMHFAPGVTATTVARERVRVCVGHVHVGLTVD